MRTLLATPLLLASLAACTPAPSKPTPPPATPTSTGGFSPLRAQSISLPGQGAWACAPGSQDALSQCRPTTSPAAPARPGLLPVRAVGGPPDVPAEGTPFTIPDFHQGAEIPMQPPA